MLETPKSLHQVRVHVRIARSSPPTWPKPKSVKLYGDDDELYGILPLDLWGL